MAETTPSIDRQIQEQEERLADVRARLPKHSVPASMLIEIEDLEAQIAWLRAQLARRQPDSGPESREQKNH